MSKPKPISQFQIYEELVKREGLYGQAFFGHKATKAQQKTLRKLHNRSIFLWKQRSKKLEEILATKASRVANDSRDDAGGV